MTGQPVDSAGTKTEDRTAGYLTDVILTRDTWMHRPDIAAGADRPVPTALEYHRVAIRPQYHHLL